MPENQKKEKEQIFIDGKKYKASTKINLLNF